jgi:hypothetical protein
VPFNPPGQFQDIALGKPIIEHHDGWLQTPRTIMERFHITDNVNRVECRG